MSKLSTLVYLKRRNKATDANFALQERRCLYPSPPGEDQAATVPRIAAGPQDSISLAKSNRPKFTIPPRISLPRMTSRLLLSISATDSLWQ